MQCVYIYSSAQQCPGLHLCSPLLTDSPRAAPGPASSTQASALHRGTPLYRLYRTSSLFKCVWIHKCSALCCKAYSVQCSSMACRLRPRGSRLCHPAQGWSRLDHLGLCNCLCDVHTMMRSSNDSFLRTHFHHEATHGCRR